MKRTQCIKINMRKIPKIISLVIPSREYDRGLLRGVVKYAHLHGPWAFYMEVLFSWTPGMDRIELFHRLKNWGANGIIMRETKEIEKIIAMGLPTIVFPYDPCNQAYAKEDIPNLSFIIADNTEVGKMGAEHLLERGFQRFAYCGFDDTYWSQKRRESFCKRIAEAGFEAYVYERPQPRMQPFCDEEQTLLANWLKSLPRAVGLMASSDYLSQQVIEACKITGLDIPEDIAILGVTNDDLYCDLSDPPLSSVALNLERAGYEAAELLDKLMAGEKVANQRVIVRPTHIVTRQSTDILAIEDRDVAEAVRFIRQHAREMLRVDDVVDEVALSRRVLERRFRKVLGRSVHDEIRRVRVEQVCQMLLETNLSVSQIASALGYPGVDHIARYFQREKGMSLLAYRKQYGGR